MCCPKKQTKKKGKQTMTLLSFWALPLKISKLFWVIFTRENNERFGRLEQRQKGKICSIAQFKKNFRGIAPKRSYLVM